VESFAANPKNKWQLNRSPPLEGLIPMKSHTHMGNVGLDVSAFQGKTMSPIASPTQATNDRVVRNKIEDFSGSLVTSWLKFSSRRVMI
jgi:hypothetical protein